MKLQNILSYFNVDSRSFLGIGKSIYGRTGESIDVVFRPWEILQILDMIPDYLKFLISEKYSRNQLKNNFDLNKIRSSIEDLVFDEFEKISLNSKIDYFESIVDFSNNVVSNVSESDIKFLINYDSRFDTLDKLILQARKVPANDSNKYSNRFSCLDIICFENKGLCFENVNLYSDRFFCDDILRFVSNDVSPEYANNAKTKFTVSGIINLADKKIPINVANLYPEKYYSKEICELYSYGLFPEEISKFDPEFIRERILRDSDLKLVKNPYPKKFQEYDVFDLLKKRIFPETILYFEKKIIDYFNTNKNTIFNSSENNVNDVLNYYMDNMYDLFSTLDINTKSIDYLYDIIFSLRDGMIKEKSIISEKYHSDNFSLLSWGKYVDIVDIIVNEPCAPQELCKQISVEREKLKRSVISENKKKEIDNIISSKLNLSVETIKTKYANDYYSICKSPITSEIIYAYEILGVPMDINPEKLMSMSKLGDNITESKYFHRGACGITFINDKEIFKFSSVQDVLNEYIILDIIHKKNPSNNIISIKKDYSFELFVDYWFGIQRYSNSHNINKFFLQLDIMQSTDDVFKDIASMYIPPKLSLEYIRGDTIAKTIIEGKMLSSELVLKYGKGIVNGLCDMRRAGVWYHRDLHPGNIIINSENDEPVIIDFGIATTDKHAEPYNNRRFGGRNDMVSLGQIMYYMATGKQLFFDYENHIPFESITNMLSKNADDVATLRNQVYDNFINGDGKLIEEYFSKIKKNISDEKISDMIINCLKAKNHEYGKIYRKFEKLF